MKKIKRNHRASLLSLLLLLAFAATGWGQQTLSPDKNLVDTEAMKNYRMKKEGFGFVRPAKEETEPTLLVTTETNPGKQFGLSAKIPIKAKNMKKGEKVLITFEAKTMSSSLETGEAKVLWMFLVSEDKKGRMPTVISLGNEWKTYYIPLEIPKYGAKENLKLVMQFGFPPQSFMLRNVGLYHFDQSVALSDLPKSIITYAGMEADAPWRMEAFQRIDSLRKGEFTLQVTQNGKPIENVGLEVKMVRHDFKWGAAVRVRDIHDKAFYIDKIAEGFNQVVLENDLKMKHFDKTESKEDILSTIDQLHRKGISVKGHVLVWPGFRYLPEAYEKNKDNPEKIRQMTAQHVADILAATEGEITHWDVVNEANTNQDLQTITGSEEILYQPFRFMKEKYPNVGRFINEYGIISQGGLNEAKQQWYHDYAQRIDQNTGGALDGIGIQCHIGTDLTPPEKMLSILDVYGSLGKKISISEFTLDIQDSLVRKIYTEDFLIAAFSHPSVAEFLFWGLKGDASSKVDIYHQDWTLGSMGEAFFGLAYQLWTTNVSDVTDGQGELRHRGFYGTYEYTYRINGEERKGKFKHLPGQKTLVKIEIP